MEFVSGEPSDNPVRSTGVARPYARLWARWRATVRAISPTLFRRLNPDRYCYYSCHTTYHRPTAESTFQVNRK